MAKANFSKIEGVYSCEVCGKTREVKEPDPEGWKWEIDKETGASLIYDPIRCLYLALMLDNGHDIAQPEKEESEHYAELFRAAPETEIMKDELLNVVKRFQDLCERKDSGSEKWLLDIQSLAMDAEDVSGYKGEE